MSQQPGQQGTGIHIRPPLRMPQPPGTATLRPPPLSFIERTWRVTHSTLPMWKKAKNVRISYKALRESDGTVKGLDDTVTSEDVDGKPEGLGSKLFSLKTIRGVDYPQGEGLEGDSQVEEGQQGVYRKWAWKGNGWLKIAGGSKWEVLGWGVYLDGNGGRVAWVVTWFEATLFTPAGVDFYSDRKDGVALGLYEKIVGSLRGLGREKGCAELGKLAEAIFPVKIDA
ncbi:hypothetical protein GLAREA_00474 [Glarea lozoyensis ATCC 20868]|uniref:Uncharacterized protein n=1 Tax=Glarea lozoyensis (strain ATCC 20868 / MF5171) TaxID=1116229 RepID=S3CWL1_GLAL2|nr:uncharacterized protein GLAREA_00474 [Glarea lozoyensis ATCC 20868]EPE29314.1 hypothetical protein GLAREA_00474 [Glarea lozoyensis ATCC 20868]